MALDKKFQKKVELAIKQKADLRKFKKGSLDSIGASIVAEMKDRISSGISPITGKRFPGYKKPKKYPGSRKPARPVNLFLTGQFLRSLKYRIRTGKIPVVTIFFSNKLAQLKEQGHREGANSQRKRPIIPAGSESFTDSILLSMRRVLRKVIDKDLK